MNLHSKVKCSLKKIEILVNHLANRSQVLKVKNLYKEVQIPVERGYKVLRAVIDYNQIHPNRVANNLSHKRVLNKA